MKVLLFGVFDYFHYGHLKLFERARKIGDHLTVAIQKDEEIHKTKPKAEILYPYSKRVEIISAIRYVDKIISYTQVDETIPFVDFDILVLGEDQTHPGFQRAINWCKENGKQLVVLPRTPNISSTQIKETARNDG